MVAGAALMVLAGLAVVAAPSSVEAPAAASPVAPLAAGNVDLEGDTPVDDGGLWAGGAGQEYVTSGTKWSDTHISYGFVNRTGDVSLASQQSAVASAFASWASVTPLTFRKVADCGMAFNAPGCTTPDIRIVFGAGDHGGGAFDQNFDGPNGVAAHAFYPPPNGASAAGDLHLDDAERWSTTGSGVDLESIVLHELGHVLGLKHALPGQCPLQSSSSRPIMCSVIVGIDRTLAQDDVNGAQALYGPPDLACAGRAVTVDLNEGEHPTAGADVVLGRPLADTINSGGGADIVCGGGGDDRIDLGAGSDRAVGGAGNDRVYGRTGNDRLEGGAGNDRLLAGDGADDVYGGPGADVLDGGAGPDELYAGPQNDTCNGRGGSDTSTGCERRASA